MRADDHDVAGRDGLGDVEDAPLLDARLAIRAAGDRTGLGVTLGDVEAFDDDRGTDEGGSILPARTEASRGGLPALLVAHDALDDAALAGILAGEDDDLITRSQVGHTRVPARLGRGSHHSTSGASEMIFM
jgi:hypothetical protein